MQLKGPDGPVPVRTVPGIDPGWAYNPGKAAYGTRLTDQGRAAMEADGAWQKYRRLTPGDYQTHGRPTVPPERKSDATLAAKADSPKKAEQILTALLGGPEKIFTGPDGMGVLVSAAALARHHSERSVYYPFVRELIEDPEEIWISLDEHVATGRVELRRRYVKLARIGKEKRAMYLVVQVMKGQCVAWTLVPLSKESSLNKQRVGKLLWYKK